MHFEKDLYLGLSNDIKTEIKSRCLFSRFSSAWVSRGYVGSYSAIKAVELAEKIGLENRGREGDKLSFADQQAVKAEKALNRAERYENRSDKAAERGDALQAPINRMHGDIAFFTQPNINSSAGRAFTNKRNKMFAAWERGFDEFKKSAYWKERAETARQTAANCEKQSIDFCQRRIDECTASIKKLGRNIEIYKKDLEKIEAGQTRKLYSGETLTAEKVNAWIDETIERIEELIDKSSYYESMIESQGGLKFNKDNINIGDKITTVRKYYGVVTVTRKGTKNIQGIRGGDSWPVVVPYPEITEIVEHAETPEKERPIEHGFREGATYTVKKWDYSVHEYKPVTVTIVKVTPDKVTVKVGDDRAKSIVVRHSYNGGYYIPVQTSNDHYEWIYPAPVE